MGSLLAAAMPLWGMSVLLLMGIMAMVIWAALRGQHAPLSAIVRSHLPLAAPPLGPVEILRERYARGEIDLATFEAMLARIEATSTNAPASSPAER